MKFRDQVKIPINPSRNIRTIVKCFNRQVLPALARLALALICHHCSVGLGHQTCQRHVRFALESNESSQAERLLIPSRNAGYWINICDIDLDGSMVLAFDQPIRIRASAWDVEININSFFVLHVSLIFLFLILSCLLKRSEGQANNNTGVDLLSCFVVSASPKSFTGLLAIRVNDSASSNHLWLERPYVNTYSEYSSVFIRHSHKALIISTIA
jgi:hypothetical protein